MGRMTARTKVRVARAMRALPETISAEDVCPRPATKTKSETTNAELYRVAATTKGKTK